jgi:hypothetical protein
VLVLNPANHQGFSTGYGPWFGLTTVITAAAKNKYYHSFISMEVPPEVPHLLPNGMNWSTFSTSFHEAMKAAHRWGHFDSTTPRPVPKDTDAPTKGEEETETETWDYEDAVARYLLSQRLPDSIMFQVGECPTACASWEQVAEHCKKERE